jgi:tape measure domain-containing protein
MDITLSVRADYESASKAFKELADSSEAVREKIEKFSKSFQSEKIDNFINRQKLLEVSMRGTRGEVESLTAAKNNYAKEIERLIKSGLDPESNAIKRLRDEQDKLKDKIDTASAAQELQNKAVKASIGILAGIGTAIVGLGAYSIKAAADIEDMTAAFTPLMGSAETAAKLVKDISMEAAKTPFEIEKIGDSVKRLLPAFQGSSKDAMEAFRMIGDTAQGNADKLNSITTAYSKSMLKGKVSMAELNMIANAGVPIYDELAKSMGISVAKMMELSSSGEITADDLTNVFKTMTSEGGIFFKGMEVSSTTFSSTLLGIKENLGIVAGEIGMKLLPAAKDIADKIYDVTRGLIEWISTGDNFERTVETMTYVLAGLTGGLAAFLVVAKGATILNTLTTAFKALTLAIASNPIGAIAVVITAVLIPALIYLYKNWDTVSTYLQQGIARIQFAFNWLASVIEEGLVVAFNTVKAAGMTLVDFIYGNIIRAVGNMLELMGKIPFVGDLFTEASEKVKSFGNAIGSLAEETRQSSKDAVKAAHEKQNAAEAELETTLAAIDAESKARRAAIEEQKKKSEESVDDIKDANDEIVEDTKKTQEEITETVDKSSENSKEKILNLVDKLRLIPLTQSQQMNENINQFTSFLNQRLDLEKLNGQERIDWLKEQEEKLLAIENLSAQEKLAAAIAINNKILEEEERLTNVKKKELAERLNEMPMSERQVQTEQIQQFTSFLEQRLELERLTGEQRIAWLKEQEETILANENINAQERLAGVIAVNEKILEEEQRLADERNTTLTERLNAIQESERAIQTKQIEEITSFLNQRLELEQLKDDERLEWLKAQSEQIKELETLDAEERVALETAVVNAIAAEEKRLADIQKKILKDKLDAASQFFKGIQDLAALGAKESIGLAVIDKAVSAAQAAINSYLAFTEALASGPPPFNYIAAAGVLASGIAAQVKILSTPIPSAETGGRFIVPNNSIGSDNTLMRVNPGEEIDVTPRGMAGNGGIQNIVVQIEKQTIFDVINNGIRSGDILIQAVNF